jgi:hypothetical protein
VGPLSRTSGCEAFGRALNEGPLLELIRSPATEWERRMQLLNLAMGNWQVGNPLVLYEDPLTSELEALLLKRFQGTDALLQLCDEALKHSVLFAPQ